MAGTEIEYSPAWKRFAKKITTNHTRDVIKKLGFQAYEILHPRRSTLNLSNKKHGINLIGHIRGDFGLGESCRLVASAMKVSGIPFSIYNLPLNGPARETDTTWAAAETADFPYGIN